MSSRILINATAVGTLVLGAAVLSGCASNSDTGTSAGATEKVTVAAGGSAGSTGTASSNSTAGGTSTQAAGGASSCTGSHISVKIDQGSSGMGHTGSVLVFTNTGSKTCTLYGYPGADVTDDGRYNYASAMNATRTSGGMAVRTVSLSPGSNASAMLEWDVNPTNGEPASAANCPGMAGGYLEVTPPNTTAIDKSEPPSDMCAALEVFPVVAGNTGQ